MKASSHERQTNGVDLIKGYFNELPALQIYEIMISTVLTAEIKRRFPGMNVVFGGADNRIATFPPIHWTWKPIVIQEDEDEVTVFCGDFTHFHFGYFGNETDLERKAQSIAHDVAKTLGSIFADECEFYERMGIGGCRPSGSQGWLSKVIFGKDGVVWSGNRAPNSKATALR